MTTSKKIKKRSKIKRHSRTAYFCPKTSSIVATTSPGLLIFTMESSNSPIAYIQRTWKYIVFEGESDAFNDIKNGQRRPQKVNKKLQLPFTSSNSAYSKWKKTKKIHIKFERRKCERFAIFQDGKSTRNTADQAQIEQFWVQKIRDAVFSRNKLTTKRTSSSRSPNAVQQTYHKTTRKIAIQCKCQEQKQWNNQFHMVSSNDKNSNYVKIVSKHLCKNCIMCKHKCPFSPQLFP